MSNQLAYDWIEDADEKSWELREFYDYCWEHHRNHMRVLIEAFAEGDGKEMFQAYLEKQGEEAA